MQIFAADNMHTVATTRADCCCIDWSCLTANLEQLKQCVIMPYCLYSYSLYFAPCILQEESACTVFLPVHTPALLAVTKPRA